MDPGWIPILAIGVGGIAVIGKVIVQPIVHALLKMNEPRAPAAPPVDVARIEQRLARLEEELGTMERSVGSLLEDRDFYRQLSAGERPRP
jgi:hypothetical protein